MRENENEMLIPKTEFIGLEEITHLCAGGESPTLKSHRAAVERFFSQGYGRRVSRTHGGDGQPMQAEGRRLTGSLS
jgi:hypothetical protein